MNDVAIRGENLSKRYKIGERVPYKAFRDEIARLFASPFRRLKSKSTPKRENGYIWALKDVSFEVKRGEVVGIIGRNGAGKTTLLKLLSRITEPTEGYIEIHGRVGSLLEVGTGFHPELTGRENIYLNGAILGMKKKEIDKKFDEIVSFAEIERFIDTPMKRYSSGMYVRLAFAVAAHMEPEILLVDEVLAVGDFSFQKKCVEKMKDVAKEGRTVLFVSHNMGTICSLCESAFLLDNGKIVKKGNANEIVWSYQESHAKHFNKSSYIVERKQEDVKNSSFYFSRVEMLNERGEYSTIYRYNEKLILIAEFSSEPAEGRYIVEYYLYNQLGQLVSVGSSGAFHDVYFNKKVRKVRIEIGPLVLTTGTYSILLSTVSEVSGLRTDTWEDACSFSIVTCQPFRPGREISSADEGSCILQHSFCAIE